LFEAFNSAHVGLRSPHPHSDAEGYSRKIHVRSGGYLLRGNQLTEAFPGEDNHVSTHAAGQAARQSFVALLPATHLIRSQP